MLLEVALLAMALTVVISTIAGAVAMAPVRSNK